MRTSHYSSIAIVILALLGSSAHAGSKPSPEYLVDRHAIIDLEVHPQMTTFVYLDSEVRAAVVSEMKLFATGVLTIADIEKRRDELPRSLTEVHERAVFIRPKPGTPTGAWGNMLIVADSYRLSIRVRVTDKPRNTDTQVFIRDKTRASSPGLAAARGTSRSDAIEQALLGQRGVGKLFRRTQTRDGVILRVVETIRLDGAQYLRFEIENRSDKAFRPATASIIGNQRTADHAGAVRMYDTFTRTPVRTVAAGTRVEGLIEVRGAKQLAGVPFTLSISELQARRIAVIKNLAL